MLALRRAIHGPPKARVRPAGPRFPLIGIHAGLGAASMPPAPSNSKAPIAKHLAPIGSLIEVLAIASSQIGTTWPAIAKGLALNAIRVLLGGKPNVSIAKSL